MICFIVGGGAAFWSILDQSSLAESVFSPRSTDHPPLAAAGGGDILTLSSAHRWCFIPFGAQLCKAIEHSGWGPIKHLGTSLSSTGLPRCLSWARARLPCWALCKGHGVRGTRDGVHAVCPARAEGAWDSPSRAGYKKDVAASVTSLNSSVVCSWVLWWGWATEAAARQADADHEQSVALREDVSTMLQPAPWAYHQLSPCPENTQFIIANEQILGPWTARYEQVDLSFSLN